MTKEYTLKKRKNKEKIMQNGTKISPEMTYNESNMFLFGYNMGYEQKNCIIEKI